MPSLSLQDWNTTRSAALDEMERAHRAIRREGAGWRAATQNVNQAYTVLLASHFQAFCRGLHDECIDLLVPATVAASARQAVRAVFLLNRRLDFGNANPGNIGADFARFDLVLWEEMERLHARTEGRQTHLDTLNRWRNAVAHQSLDPAVLGGTVLRIQEIRIWRQACHHLAATMDEVMRRHLQALIGRPPW